MADTSDQGAGDNLLSRLVQVNGQDKLFVVQLTMMRCLGSPLIYIRAEPGPAVSRSFTRKSADPGSELKAQF